MTSDPNHLDFPLDTRFDCDKSYSSSFSSRLGEKAHELRAISTAGWVATLASLIFPYDLLFVVLLWIIHGSELYLGSR